MKRLSVLDTQWPGVLTSLVVALERMGYYRYWATEHHNPRQSASPTVMAALGAGLTSQMRVGTAGVLLRLTSAMRVAEDFALLELYFPGRIDLGIAGADVATIYQQQYAFDAVIPAREDFAHRLRRTVALIRSGLESEEGNIPVGPVSADECTAAIPQLWLCGMGQTSAELAGKLGLRFAYHHYLADIGERRDMRQVVDSYRTAFVPYSATDGPYVAVAAFGSCAPTFSEAEAEWRGHFAGRAVPKPTFLGSPHACAETLSALAKRYSADELAVDCLTTSLSTRLSGLESIIRTLC